MKSAIAALALLLLSSAALAQNPDASKWTCRKLSDSGGFLEQGETIFGVLACRPIGQPASPAAQPPAAPAQPAAAPADPAQPAPSSAPAAASSDAPATIVFYRAKRFQGSALKPSVFVDETRVGSLHNGDSVQYSLAPGNHRVYSTDKSTGIDLEVKPGQTYYVRIDILVGFWKGHGGVTLVDPQQGKYEVERATH
jgi:hypothetical protein